MILDEIEWKKLKTIKKVVLRKDVINKLTEKGWLCYPTKNCTQEEVEEAVPKVQKIIKYIYDRKLCHVSYLAYMSEKDLKDILK